ncbi:MAG: LptF/LptG family permease [Bacteroidales bacterium OttesenSCG-928-I14]|jgi:lipopolysaccharide export system permease protein|nr:LptF/LptG family permease [Bacteroidales bacterium OttesenSCG-928-I14]
MNERKFPKIIDLYIFRKFICTYFFSISIIIVIVVIFDFNEKLDRFVDAAVPVRKIILDYYLNFIPYIAGLLSPLFVFISVIFFTCKLTYNSEIIAILSSGISFGRLMLPYMISAAMIASISFLFSSYVIPLSNIKRINFCDFYISDKNTTYLSNIQLEIKPDVIAHFEYFDPATSTGYRFSLEKFNDKDLVSRVISQQIVWKEGYHWTLRDYMIRDFVGMKERISIGKSIDTILEIIPSDFAITSSDYDKMITPKLKTYIKRSKRRGVGNMQFFEIEYYKRYAMILTSFILTIIGVSLSSQKIKEGIGMNIGIGLLLSFSYILFIQISSSFSVSGLVSPLISVWIPNVIYVIIAIFLYNKVVK